MFSCEVCNREFARKQNLEWHLAGQGHIDKAGLAPKSGSREVRQLMGDDYCSDCYTKDREIDKKDRELEQAAMSLGNLDQSFKELQSQPAEAPTGHTSLVDLLSCPTHAPSALDGYDGIVVPPGTITPDTAASLKRLVPMLGDGINIDLSGVHGL